MLDFLINNSPAILVILTPIVIMSPYILYKSVYQSVIHNALINTMETDKNLMTRTLDVCDRAASNMLDALPKDAAPNLAYFERVGRNVDVIQSNLGQLSECTDTYIETLTNPDIAPIDARFIGSMLLCSLVIAAGILIYKYFNK